ncbi:hypothetical protein Pst134EA_013027 [Puccinia striiformis f. sp. tritici]|uniref:hypothetical protein n=1 Tax=Puccinia striiformis f. sp. tritici TaxID=168172 RepID=UPI0020085B7C|nr:hypothetical protein Pst134EA_013027 [Puccinia striiformis f. sp. tritici]KAH9465132.1 hypothetical protein Pst134EA_013027 [Puccinia striiformis f. sp. tritici]
MTAFKKMTKNSSLLEIVSLNPLARSTQSHQTQVNQPHNLLMSPQVLLVLPFRPLVSYIHLSSSELCTSCIGFAIPNSHWT